MHDDISYTIFTAKTVRIIMIKSIHTPLCSGPGADRDGVRRIWLDGPQRNIVEYFVRHKEYLLGGLWARLRYAILDHLISNIR